MEGSGSPASSRFLFGTGVGTSSLLVGSHCSFPVNSASHHWGFAHSFLLFGYSLHRFIIHQLADEHLTCIVNLLIDNTRLYRRLVKALSIRLA